MDCSGACEVNESARTVTLDQDYSLPPHGICRDCLVAGTTATSAGGGAGGGTST